VLRVTCYVLRFRKLAGGEKNSCPPAVQLSPTKSSQVQPFFLFVTFGTFVSPHLLPQDERDLLEAKYLDGRSVRQIADMLQISEKAVESRLVRIRRKLKGQMLERLKDEPSS